MFYRKRNSEIYEIPLHKLVLGNTDEVRGKEYRDPKWHNKGERRFNETQPSGRGAINLVE